MIRAATPKFRAPKSAELDNPGMRFDTAIEDQCDSTNVPVPANCAQLVPPGYTQLNPQISVTTGGNPGLEPETSETWTTGFTWDTGVAAGIIDRLLLEVNYYDITIDGAIQAPNAQETLNACIATLDPFFLRRNHPDSERNDLTDRRPLEKYRGRRDDRTRLQF